MGIRRALIVMLIVLTITPVVVPIRAAVTQHRVVIYAGPVREPYLADVYSSQPDSAAGLDAYLRADTPTTNNGGAAQLGAGEPDNSAIGNVWHSVLKFDLSSIPNNATVNSATLTLYHDLELASQATTLGVYRLKRAFVEAQVTWNVYSTGNSWEIAGGTGSADTEVSAIGSRVMTSTEANGAKDVALDVAAVEEMVSGVFANNGFMLMNTSSENDWHRFVSSDGATESQRPKLVIDYTIPTNTPTATNTATATNTPTATDTATATNTPTATPANRYEYPLSSGKTLTVWGRMSFGEMFSAAILVALLLAFAVFVIYKVIEKWT